MEKIPTTTESDSLIIELPASVDPAFAEIFEVECKGWLVNPASLYVLDFKHVLAIRPGAYRALLGFARLVRQGDKRIASRNMRGEVLQQLKTEGLLSTFNPVASTAAAKCERLDVTLINPFVSAVVDTLKIQARTESQPGKPCLVRGCDREANPETAVVGLIEVGTQDFQGAIALLFTAPVILKIYENMLDEKLEAVTPELCDATAELLNIIYGTAKTQLNQNANFQLKTALPKVVTSEPAVGPKAKILVLPFESAAGSFRLEIRWD